MKAMNAEAYLKILAIKRDLREYDSILFAVLHTFVLLRELYLYDK